MVSETITKIIVERAEGPHWDCRKPKEYTTFKDADKRIQEIMQTAPNSGGYDKTDVTICFDDGDTIKCRFDVKRNDSDGPIYDHVLRVYGYLLANPLGDKDIKPDEVAKEMQTFCKAYYILKEAN
jgi:hypothetical protein